MKTTYAIAPLLPAIPLIVLSAASSVLRSGDGGRRRRHRRQGGVPGHRAGQEDHSRPRTRKCAAARVTTRRSASGRTRACRTPSCTSKRCAKGKAWSKQDKTPELDNAKCRFEPAVQVIRPAPSTFINSDPVLHNTHGFYGKRTAFNLALPNKGDKIPADLPRPGLVRVECDAHGWMLAHVYVADSPYYALTGKDGSFSITDIPPGDYTVVAVAELHRRHRDPGDGKKRRDGQAIHRAEEEIACRGQHGI